MTLKNLKDQEREINDEYRKISLKKEEIRKKTTSVYHSVVNLIKRENHANFMK